MHITVNDIEYDVSFEYFEADRSTGYDENIDFSEVIETETQTEIEYWKAENDPLMREIETEVWRRIY